jgi:hypothetical protein
MWRLIICGLVAATALAAAGAHRSSEAQQSQGAAPDTPFMPSLADLMALTQWRHLKLAYSGIVSNWPLAGYELRQIRQSFPAAAQLYPVLERVPLARLIKEESEPRLPRLPKPPKARTAAISPKLSGS